MVEGFVIINKPTGITSFDLIRRLRKIVKIKKMGHAGTLDPLATGVMVIAIGGATRLLQYIEAAQKGYFVTFEWGYETDTLDSEGKIVAQATPPYLNQESFQKELLKFCGESHQIPPMYSALKIDGKRLYELARQNIHVERQSRKIVIDHLETIQVTDKEVSFKATVSKGTYIRTLVQDIAHHCGSVATMTALCREFVGGVTLENSLSLEEIEEKFSSGDQSWLISTEIFFKELPVVEVSEKYFHWFLQGRAIATTLPEGLVKIEYQGRYVGIGTNHQGMIIRKYVKEEFGCD